MTNEEIKIKLQGTKRELMERIPILTDMVALLKTKDVGTIYAYQNDLNSVRRKGKPKVVLSFLEDSNFNKLAAPNKIYEGLRR